MAPDARDIRSVMSRTVLAAVMTTLVVSLFSVGAAALSAGTAGTPSVGLLGLLAAALAAGYHPVLVQARTTIDELLFGGRPDPVVTLSRLGEQLSEGTEPAEWLESLRRALAVSGLLLRRDDVVLAQAGERDGTVTSVQLRVGALVAGSLEVTLPPEQVQLPPTTRAVLQLVSTPLAQAVHAAHLTEELQRSRVQVVGVLEDERRRMRRDLHDGLGPTLTGVAYTADAAANLVGTDPVQASELLRELRADVAAALAEIRRIVYGLRPRALDELGLVRAVQQGVERLRTAQGRPFAVTTSAPPLPELPAAVEVVAYRVAVEALTNAARHAHVEGARLELSVGDCLELVISDDGRSDGAWSEGVGIASMRERVAQVGGVLEVGGGSSGGRVRAELPLRRQQGVAPPAQAPADDSMASRSRTA
jgi:signal transduction histidine kinase